jgi:hypothetical protein
LFERKVTPRFKANLAAETTVTPGEVLVRARAVKRACYEWQYSFDGGKTWVSMGTTTEASNGVQGLTVGGSYLFRFRTTVKRATAIGRRP